MRTQHILYFAFYILSSDVEVPTGISLWIHVLSSKTRPRQDVILGSAVWAVSLGSISASDDPKQL